MQAGEFIVPIGPCDLGGIDAGPAFAFEENGGLTAQVIDIIELGPQDAIGLDDDAA